MLACLAAPAARVALTTLKGLLAATAAERLEAEQLAGRTVK
jgi:hypothetical protein